jgi:hypothetical protein
MKCNRCGRAMVYEQFFGDQERFWGWRCIFCGEIVDDVILENRRWLRAKVVPDKKTECPSQEGETSPGEGNRPRRQDRVR